MRLKLICFLMFLSVSALAKEKTELETTIDDLQKMRDDVSKSLE